MISRGWLLSNNKTKIFKIVFSKLIFVSIILASFAAILWLFKDDILLDHDLAYAFGRKFFFPEHGRYIATFINHILTENLPEVLNIHPNDFQTIFINPLKAVFTICIFLFFSYSLFIFSENRKPFFSLSFILTYIVIFLFLFNGNFLFFLGNEYQAYFSFMENTVFWEYPMTFFMYIPFLLVLIYFYTRKIHIPPNLYICLIIVSFLLSTSVEPINNAVFISFCLFACFLLIKNKFRITETIKKNSQFFGILFSAILGFIAYYINPAGLIYDHPLNTDVLTYKEYIFSAFSIFIKKYIRFFFIENVIFLLIPLALCIHLKISDKYETTTDKNALIQIVLFNITAFLLFFFAIFLIGYCFNRDVFWFEYKKWSNMYALSCLFFSLVLTGFIIDKNKLFKNYSNKIKVVACIIILVIFSKPLIFENYQRAIEFKILLKNLKKKYYSIEKIAITQTDSELYLPAHYKQMINGDDWWLLSYIKSVHPDICKTKIIFSDKIDENILTQEEEKELKFSNLLRYKRFRNKKDFNSFRPNPETKVEI